ncbi:MAG TPA: YgiT-type zinc finger protein [Candidatus Brocadiaceae bacterium]|nr:YgiT-type zinc finger protein [Candidatus Brocadiaceae bacterium]
MDKKDICSYCEGEIDLRSIRARFHFKGKTIYVDNVPASVCSTCGEHYFDAPVYKRLEEIAKHSEGIKKTVSFPLAEYDMAIT